jgi:hypothetical protein
MTRTWPPSCDEATASIVTPLAGGHAFPHVRDRPRTPVPDAAGRFRLGGQIVAISALIQSDETLRQARLGSGGDGGRRGTADADHAATRETTAARQGGRPDRRGQAAEGRK